MRPLPLSALQTSVWLAQQALGDSPALNVCQATHLVGRLDRSALRSSLQALVDRHPALRTAFAQADGHPVQWAQDAGQIDYSEVPLGGTGEDGHQAWLDEQLRRFAATPFDLGKPPLIRARLLTDGGEQHVLAIVCHHLVFDGWSARLLIQDLGRHYRPGLPTDHAAEHAEESCPEAVEPGQEEVDRHIAYWRKTLQGYSPLELPTDRPRPPGPGRSGQLLRFDIPDELGQSLRALAARLACTQYMLLLATYALALRDYCGQDDIGIATPLAGRLDRRHDRVLGLFANTLLLRVDLAGDPTFGQVSRRARDAVLGAIRHQALPLDRISRELDLPRRPAADAPFCAGFSLQDAGETTPRLAGLAATRIPILSGATRCDLWLTLLEEQGRLHGEIEYDGRLFDAATLRAFADHFVAWLDAVCRDPECRIDALAIPVRQAGADTPARPANFPAGGVLDLFLAQCARTPDAIAVDSREATLTYREVETLSRQLAGELVRGGVTKEQPVAVRMERSAALVVGFLATLRSGGVYLPIDPELPAERVAMLLRDSSARILLTDHADAHAGDSGARTLCVESIEALARLPDAAHLPPAFDAGDAAYLLYTSGSTGTPKGVVNLHGGLCNHIQWLVDELDLGADDRMLFKTSIGFDPSVQEMLAPLCAGGRVVVAEPGGHRDMPYLVRTVREKGITLLQVVPSALRALLGEADAGRMQGLRHVICGGEILPGDLARKLHRLLPAATLGNFYGPTEASCDATHQRDDGSIDAGGNLPIGLPIANARVRVMQRMGAPREVPTGGIGELCIGGAGLARGYLNRPDLTALAFVDDPLLPGARLYRTGDLARRRADGRLEYLGRGDNLIKLRGFRIDPAEIEAALRGTARVEDCRVLLVDRPPAGAQLVAFCTGTTAAAAELAERLRTTLPSHMIPGAFVSLPAFPLLPGGKIDQRALLQQLAPADSAEPATRPRSPQEEAIWFVWRELLPSRDFGVHDDFFDLGGHSLLATQAISRIRDTLRAELSIREFMDNPTVAQLATLVATRADADGTRVDGTRIAAQARSAADHSDFPVSFSQRRMWFVQAYAPDTTAYNMPFSMRLAGPLDVEMLADAFRQVTGRHEAFRTTFPLVDGEPVQRVGAVALQVPLTVRSFEGNANPDAAIATWFREESLQTFDLTQGPLHRVFVARIAPGDHVLLWIVHHAIGDQWSAGILLKELLATYQAGIDGKPVELPALPIQYADYAVWQRQSLSEEFLAPQLAYWRNQLEGLQPLDLPAATAPAGAGAPGAVAFGVIPDELMARLGAFCTEHGVTPYMTLLAAFNVLLSRLTGQTDVAVGSPIANRHHRQSESLVGTLVNTLVIRTDLSGDPTFRELLSRTRGVALDAYANQDVPYEKLVEEHGSRHGRGHGPLVQVLFNVVNAIGRIAPLPTIALQPFEFDPGSAQFDLSLSIGTDPAAGSTGRMAITYSRQRFDADSVRRLVDRFLLLLSQGVTDPDQPISRLDLLLEDERAQLSQRNDTWCDYPGHLRVDQLFEAQAATNPERIAVRGVGEEYSYRDLQQLVLRIAEALREHGVGPGSLVGIHLDRTTALPAALLAVMRVGATYVPLDPSFPTERLQFMASDSAVQLLLTHSWLGAGEIFDVAALQLDKLAPRGRAPHREAHVGQPDALAYVLYTSGSTGKPKGVEIPHRALTNFIWSMRREPGFQAGDSLLAITTLSFDISGLEIFLPLVCGGTVVLAGREEARDGRLLASAFLQHRPTVMQATPSTWRMLIGTGWKGTPTLRILCGGEALPPDLAQPLLERCGELWNMYGPTETTIWSTVARITKPEDIHIGRPIANTTTCILGSSLEPLPPGWIGELCIGGHGLAQGYRGRQDLTDQRFVPSPIPGITGEKVYRTGDLARQLPDGRLLHLGRSDFQVKIRGFRIELGDVESALVLCANPAQAVVTARDDGTGNMQLVAYLVPSGQQAFHVPELRQQLRQHLPEYMIPAHFVVLETLPLTANRKVDLKALPDPVVQPDATRTALQPQGRMEVQLTALWRQALGDDTLGVEDDFFERGGHSLLAVQLASQIEEVTGLRLPLATLFEAPTVASMARLLTSGKWKPSWRSLVAIQPLGNRPPLFLVPGVGGNVLMFAALARRLGHGIPVYGLQARGLDEAEAPFTSIVRMARSHIGEMRAVRHTGPWYVAGTCTGGVVAFEIARQLRLAGETVHLVLLDTWHPVTARRSRAAGGVLARGGRTALGLAATSVAMAAGVPRRIWRFLRRIVRPEWKLQAWQQERLRDTRAEQQRARVTSATWRAVTHYNPPRIRGDLLHVIAANRQIPEGVVDSRPRWATLVEGEARSESVGAIDSGQLFVEPHVDAVAALLRDYLADPADRSASRDSP